MKPGVASARLRKRISLSRLLSASRCSVRSCRTLTKPTICPASSRNEVTWPDVQKRLPVLRRCHRSSSRTPVCAADRIPIHGPSPARPSGVKMRSIVSPSISCSLQPKMWPATSFQRVTLPSRSVAMIA